MSDKYFSLITEIYTTNHFIHRLDDRLINSSLSPEDKSIVRSQIKQLLSVKTPRTAKYKIAVRIYTTDIPHEYKDYTRKTKYIGNEIWVIVQERILKTILIEKSKRTKDPIDVQRIFNVSEVYYSIEDLKTKYV